MGGRGSGSSASRTAGTASVFTPGGGGLSAAFSQPLNQAQQQPNIQNQAPSTSNTPVVTNAVSKLSQMTDDQLATLVNQSKRVDMPNHLSDVSDATQKFVYAAGINEKPTVLDDAAFKQYMADNGIRQSQMLARTVDGAQYVVNGTQINLQPAQVTQMIRDSALTYVGGKVGGMVHGAGTYFDQNGGKPTGYGSRSSKTAIAVLDKSRAKVIDHGTLDNMARGFARSHPKTARAIGPYNHRTMSIYALTMGYNVIRSGSYHNVIDRAALVMRSTDY